MSETSPNGDRPAPPATRQRSSLPLIILAGLFIVVPFLTWYFTWFGRNLSDADIATYLADEKNPRHMQHALSQIAERIERRDPSVKKFYPQIVSLSKNPTGEIRKTTAWVMGQDNTSEEFHQALLALLKDSEPLVLRNAALQLVRFGDASGRPELRAMLQPFEVKSSLSGTIVSLLAQGAKVRAGGLLARIRDSSGTVQEFRSPVDGTIASLMVKEGNTVQVNQTIASINPDEASLGAALRALAYVGTAEDLPLIRPLSQSTSNAEIASQAALTAKAIQSRD